MAFARIGLGLRELRGLIRNPNGLWYSDAGRSSLLPTGYINGIAIRFSSSEHAPEVAAFESVETLSKIEPDVTEVHPNKEDKKKPKKRKKKESPELVKLPQRQADSLNEVASIVVSLHEIAFVTMTRGLTIIDWRNYPISEGIKTKSHSSKIEQYYKDVEQAVNGLTSQAPTIDLFIMEERYFKFSVPFMSSHFLIVKSIMHSLLSHRCADYEHKPVAYASWTKTGKIFDLFVDGNTRKSGKEKVNTILHESSWGDNDIRVMEGLVKVTESGIKVKNFDQTPPELNEHLYMPMTEEMADAFLQALAFWTTIDANQNGLSLS